MKMHAYKTDASVDKYREYIQMIQDKDAGIQERLYKIYKQTKIYCNFPKLYDRMFRGIIVIQFILED